MAKQDEAGRHIAEAEKQGTLDLEPFAALFDSADRRELVGYYLKDLAAGDMAFQQLVRKVRPREMLAVAAAGGLADAEVAAAYGLVLQDASLDPAALTRAADVEVAEEPPAGESAEEAAREAVDAPGGGSASDAQVDSGGAKEYRSSGVVMSEVSPEAEGAEDEPLEHASLEDFAIPESKEDAEAPEEAKESDDGGITIPDSEAGSEEGSGASDGDAGAFSLGQIDAPDNPAEGEERFTIDELFPD